jgi:hypothetical protein
MNFCIHAGSQRLVLPLQVKAPSVMPPELLGLMISRVFASAAPQSAFIELRSPGMSRPFAGDTWQYEVRRDGDGLWAFWVGIPDIVLQSPPGDLLLRIGLEAVGGLTHASAEKGSSTPLEGIHLASVHLAVDAATEASASQGPWHLDYRRPPFAD